MSQFIIIFKYYIQKKIILKLITRLCSLLRLITMQLSKDHCIFIRRKRTKHTANCDPTSEFSNLSDRLLNMRAQHLLRNQFQKHQNCYYQLLF